MSAVLQLEPLQAEHADAMFEVLSDPAIYEFENAPPASREWLRARYQRLALGGPADGSERWLNWVIRLPDGALAGYVQATVFPSGLALVAYELNSRSLGLLRKQGFVPADAALLDTFPPEPDELLVQRRLDTSPYC